METLKFLGLVVLTWLFVTGAAPIQFLKRLVKIHNDDKPRKLFGQVMQKLVNCSLCSGFWIGLLYYSINGSDLPILMACLVAYCANLFHNIDKSITGTFFKRL